MSIVEQLQYQATKLKKAGTTKAAAEVSGSAPQKKVEDMTIEEQLAYSASRLKPAGASR